MTVLLVLIPIFLIIFLGWFLKRIRVVDSATIHSLNNFAYYVALPALIVGAFWEINFTDHQSLRLILLSLVFSISFCVVTLFLLSLFEFKKSLKAAIFLGLTSGNTIYMGVPLVGMGFGHEYLESGVLVGVIYLIIPLLIAIALTQHYYCQEHRSKGELGGFLKNPLVISALSGIILSFLSINSPLIDGAKSTIAMLGATASPVALFALGAFMHGKFFKKDLKNAFLVSALKMTVAPVVVLIGALYFDAGDNLKVLTFLAAMPVSITAFVIAEKFDLDKDLIGNSIIISTFMSFGAAFLLFSLLA